MKRDGRDAMAMALLYKTMRRWIHMIRSFFIVLLPRSVYRSVMQLLSQRADSLRLVHRRFDDYVDLNVNDIM